MLMLYCDIASTTKYPMTKGVANFKPFDDEQLRSTPAERDKTFRKMLLVANGAL